MRPRDPQDGPPYGGYGPNQPPAGYGQAPAGLGPGYGQGAGSGAPLARPRNGLGIAALVLGLLALVLFWTIIGGILFGILALIFGLLGRARAKRGEATNGGMSVTGAVLGVIGLLMTIGLVWFGLSLLNSPAGRNYQQCVERSGEDPAKRQQCLSELIRQVGGG